MSEITQLLQDVGNGTPGASDERHLYVATAALSSLPLLTATVAYTCTHTHSILSPNVNQPIQPSERDNRAVH